MSFPSYPDYRDSGIAWLGKVPSHWLVMPLKRRFSVTLGKMLQPDAKTDDDIERPYLRAANIKWGQIEIDDMKTMWFSPHEANNLELRTGDLLVSEGGDVGRSAIWRNEVANCHFQNSVNRVRALTDSRTDFLFYWMSTIKAKGYVDVLCNKSTIAHFTAEKVAAVPVPVPTPDEQAAISAFLDRETAKIDGLVAEQKRLIALLTEKRQAVISHTIARGLNSDVPMKDSGSEWLGEIPAHWKLRRIGSVSTKITNGYVGPTRDILVDDGVRYLQSLHIKRNQINFHSPYFVTEEWNQQHVKSILKAGDVLIVQTGDIGQVAVVPREFAGCNCHALIIVSPADDVLQGEWLAWVLNSAYGLSALLAIQTGALHPHLNCGNVKDVAIPLPPIDEQSTLVAHIENRTRDFDRLIDEAQSAITLLQERRAALISAAVTGKIDVRGVISPNNVISIDTAHTSAVQPSIRASVGALSIRTLGSMGRMAVMKGGYLAEGYAGISELGGTYQRDAAGPFCRAVIDGMERDAAQAFGIQVIETNKDGERVTYREPSNFALPANDLPALIGEDRAKQLTALFDLLKDLNRDGVEAIATLFAVWNDLLACGKSADENAVIGGVLEDWHPEKAVKFNRETLAHWLA